MGILGRLFGQGQQDSDEAQAFEALAHDLLARYGEHLSEGNDHAAALILAKLLRKEALTFAKQTVTDYAVLSQIENAHYFAGKPFRDLKVVVSIIPSVDLDRAKRYFIDVYADGYYDFLALLLTSPDADLYSDFAHWVFCCDADQAGLHLTYISAMGRTPRVFLIAEELLTPDEYERVNSLLNPDPDPSSE
jgi:hypothetical protein